MAYKSTFQQPLLVAFQRDTRGAVAVSFAILAVMLFGFVGLSVDVVRGWNLSNRVGQGLDAAALAGAKKLDEGGSDGDIRSVVQAYFDQHMTNLNVGSVTLAPLNVAIDRDASTVDVRARGTVGTTFAAVMGYTTMQLDKSATVKHSRRKVELIMALDVTGSMSPAGKLEAMKVAATDVVDLMFDESANDEQIRVGLVPWASSVNAGPLASAVSNGQSFDGCVIERLGSQAATAAPPYGANALRASPAPAPAPYEFYFCPPDSVIPLSRRTNRGVLKSAINGYSAMGGTAGHIGAAWGHYLLSPEWSSFLPSESGPRPYNPAETLKVLVLLTDGEFNMSYVTPGAYDAALQTDQSYAMFQALCSDIRAKNIVIYTVGFQLTNARAGTELATCSDASDQHFAAATNEELRMVFRRIANQIMQLRVTR